MTIDIVVVNYHTPEDLEEFTDSLYRHPPSQPATLTIVDVEAEVQFEPFQWVGGPGIRLGFPDNIGYAGACNAAVTYGSGEHLALFNADVTLSDGAVDHCSRWLNEPGVGVVGPRQVDAAGKIRHAGIFGSHRRPVHRGWGAQDRGQYHDVCDAVTVSGSAYFVRRDVWRQLTLCPLYQEIVPDASGAFLPTPHYYEETWCSYHAAAHGHRVLYCGEVTVMHKWHRASPVGGFADTQMPVSRALFRKACEHHGIECD